MDHPSTTFGRPLAVSVAVHVLLFGTALAFAHYGEALFRGGPRVITVDLVGEGGTAAAGGKGRAVPARSTVVREARDVPDPVRAAEVTADERGAAEAVPEAAGRGGGAEGPADAAGGFPGVAASGGAGSPAGSGGLLSPEQWRMLQAALEKAKSYPRLARERGIEGTVLVRFRVQPSGAVQEVNVVRSSGAEILDDATVRTVRRAGPMPYVDGWIEVPVVYELK